MDPDNYDSPKGGRRFGCGHVLLFVLAAVLLTAGLTFWFVRTYVSPRDFEPVQLSVKEERRLEAKLEQLQVPPKKGSPSLEPEPYSEGDADREISLTERELNALLAKNTDLARKGAVDLSKDLISIRMLVPVDEDFPILGGKTVRVRIGAEFAFREGRPAVILKGVSVMGVPMPNAWLGGLKNTDLVREFSSKEGFWKTFADGVEYISVDEGVLKIRLKE